LSSRRNSALINRRAGKPHTSMFLRMLMRAAVLRRGRAASALLAMVVAAAVATAITSASVARGGRSGSRRFSVVSVGFRHD